MINKILNEDPIPIEQMRPDLPEVVADASAAGFTFVQLNTNGLRLAAGVVGLAEVSQNTPGQ